MKKVFLLFGIAAFSSASAQQQDLFDIQKHLQKIQVENKKADKKNSLVLQFNKPFPPVSLYTRNTSIDSYNLPNGDRVVISSLDHMPCIQPDMSQFQTMPNVIYDKPFNFSPQKPLPGQVPNGSAPYRMIVSK